jgi:hypothetical protein
MAITCNWKIEQLDVAPSEGNLSNVVCRVHWRLLASNGTQEVDTFGDLRLGPPDQSAFINYSSLTKATVVQWLELAINARVDGEPTVEQLKQSLAARLAPATAAFPVPTPLPWA